MARENLNGEMAVQVSVKRSRNRGRGFPACQLVTVDSTNGVYLWCIHQRLCQVIRTQVYLTSRQRDQLAAIASYGKQRQSELIREAVDRFIEQHGRERREAVLREAAGIWEDRSDLPPLRVLRESWNRD